jgi:hypothetical protein
MVTLLTAVDDTRPASLLQNARAMQTIEREQLDQITGGAGSSDLKNNWGYSAGKWVTQGLLNAGMPDTACQQVGGPLLKSLGFQKAGNAAEQAVRDTCGAAGVPVK